MLETLNPDQLYTAGGMIAILLYFIKELRSDVKILVKEKNDIQLAFNNYIINQANNAKEDVKDFVQIVETLNTAIKTYNGRD